MIARHLALVLLAMTGRAVGLATVAPSRLHALANRAIHHGALPQAALILDRAIATCPSPRTYLLKALLMERMGLWDAARMVFRNGNRCFPTDGQLLQAWGLLESRKGEAKVAVRLLRRSVIVDDSLAPVLKWQRFKAERAPRGVSASIESEGFYAP
ncbi:hypothetical protein KFE25_011886 [Diacronema lutheri]|uniref:Uncharacterized protein n=1 Tax=Diacronema lutheri TaxID=2081491 RepID=A0A8J5XCB1_DIALT|nr:hypothetical protein KFE25_011886 [Diacronema lutheri]